MKDIRNIKVEVYSISGKVLPPTNLRVAKTIVGRKKAKWIEVDKSIVLLYSKSEFKALKKLVIKEEGGVCYICGSILNYNEATVDHIIPKSKGGSDFRYNLACSCTRCNEDKKNLTLNQYIKHIEKNKENYDYIELKYLKAELIRRRSRRKKTCI